MILLLIRHTEYDGVNVMLTGRSPGHALNAQGREHAREIAAAVAPFGADALLASPLQRTRETAAFLGAFWNLPVQENPDFIELDYGEWTGRPVASMRGDPVWEQWSRHRSVASIAGGESMAEVLERTARGLAALQREYPDGRVAVVSHGDIIKACVVPLLGVPLDDIPSFKIDPGSISILQANGEGFLRVLTTNLASSSFQDFCREHALMPADSTATG